MSNLILTAAPKWLISALNSISLFLDRLIYKLMSLAFQVFIAVSEVNLFGDDGLRKMINQIFTVLGVVMLFIMAYEIILLIINPEKLSGENGAKRLVTKVLTSIILLILLPTIFNYMQLFQKNIIRSDVIGNLIMGTSSSSSGSFDLKKSGTKMSLSIATAFFYPASGGKEYSYLSCLDNTSIEICETYITTYNLALDNNDPSKLFSKELKDYIKSDDDESNGEREMRYIPFISTIAAGFAIYAIIAFSLDLGIRVAKLAFLQVVSPIPIAMNITEKESIFGSKWFGQLKETYLEVFMKLFVIYFSMYVISEFVPSLFTSFAASNEGGIIVQSLATVIVVLGILQFAKKGPELIKQLFNMELDISVKRRLNENTFAQRGVATALGAGSVLASNIYKNTANAEDGFGNKLKGFGSGVVSGVGGLGRGAVHGFTASKGIDSWDKVGGAAQKARTATDAATTAREASTKQAIENAVQKRIAGRNLTSEEIEEIRKEESGLIRSSGHYFGGMYFDAAEAVSDKLSGAKKWLGGEASAEKLEAARQAQTAYKSFIDNMTVGDNLIPAYKEAEKEALSDLSRGVVEDHLITEYNDLMKEKDANYIAKSKTELVSKHRADLETFIEDRTKGLVSARTVKNFNDRAHYQAEADKYITTLNDTLKTLGSDSATKILKSGGFDSIKDLEKSIADGTISQGENFKNLGKVKSAMDREVSMQQAAYYKEVEKDKK